jgi:NADH-quinone oxidoreductase subunit H
MTLLKLLLGVVVIAVVVLLNTVVVMWCERKWAGHLQSRLGPMRTGWHGVLQPFADALKMLGKEAFVPAGVDKTLFMIAPVLAYVPSILIYCATPWMEQFAGFSLDTGIFMVFAVAALFPVAILLAGWASHNKYATIGGFRAAAQQISYEVPMILAVLGDEALCDRRCPGRPMERRDAAVRVPALLHLHARRAQPHAVRHA